MWLLVRLVIIPLGRDRLLMMHVVVLAGMRYTVSILVVHAIILAISSGCAICESVVVPVDNLIP